MILQADPLWSSIWAKNALHDLAEANCKISRWNGTCCIHVMHKLTRIRYCHPVTDTTRTPCDTNATDATATNSGDKDKTTHAEHNIQRHPVGLDRLSVKCLCLCGLAFSTQSHPNIGKVKTETWKSLIWKHHLMKHDGMSHVLYTTG